MKTLRWIGLLLRKQRKSHKHFYVPTNNQHLGQTGRASLRGQPKVIPKSKDPWL